MGAIFGVIGASDDSVLAEMGRRLAHRSERVTTRRAAPDVALGGVHREGVEPILEANGKAVVADGMVYNAAELRLELGLPAAADASRRTAELVLAVVDRHGPAGIDRLKGDFTAVVVGPDDIIVLRDFLGCRPLYQANLPGGGFAFATEYKALLAIPGLPAVPDRQAIQDVQCAKYAHMGRTLLQHVAETMPGEAATYTRQGEPRARHPMPPVRVEVRIRDEGEAIRAIREGFEAAMRRRTADVDRLAVALSGGIDSIATAFMMRKIYPDRPIMTFTVGDGPDDPEMVTAAAVAAKINAEHHALVLGPDAIARQLESMAWNLEDPVARSEALQLWCLAQSAKGKTHVMFTGQGADIQFAGMPSYKLLWFIEKIPVGMIRHGIHEFMDLNYHSRAPTGLFGKLFDQIYNRGRLKPPPRVPGTKLFDLSKIPPVGPEFINQYLVEYLQHGICTDAHKVDRAFGSVGIEFRSNFYDIDFVRMAYSITSALKIVGGKQKYILRKALEGIVADEFRQVPKRPQRMRYDLRMAEAIDALAARYLTPSQVAARGFFEPASVAALVRTDKTKPYSPEAAMRIWTAALTEIWALRFLERRGAPA